MHITPGEWMILDNEGYFGIEISELPSVLEIVVVESS